MKCSKNVFMLAVLALGVSVAFAQDRRRQIEVFAGAAIPLAPQAFKDYYKVGGSLHGQYVLFPKPNLGVSLGLAIEGFTVDQDAVLADYGLTGTDATIEATASIFEIGVGIRPYLTPQTASTQFFLFGMGTYNALSEEATVTYLGQTASAKVDGNKVGLAAGAGVELPAGEKVNLIVQGLTRFIFTEGSTTSFMGVTLGVVF